MILAIKSNNKLFNSKEFKEDKYKFGRYIKDLSSPDLKLFSKTRLIYNLYDEV